MQRSFNSDQTNLIDLITMVPEDDFFFDISGKVYFLPLQIIVTIKYS